MLGETSSAYCGERQRNETDIQEAGEVSVLKWVSVSTVCVQRRKLCDRTINMVQHSLSARRVPSVGEISLCIRWHNQMVDNFQSPNQTSGRESLQQSGYSRQKGSEMSTGQQQQPAQPAQPATQTEFEKLLKRPVKFGPKGVDLENLDDVWRFATMVTQSGIAPKGMNTPQAVMIAVAMGAELGLKPMMAIQNIAVINGRPSIWGDAMLALCRQSGLFDEAVFDETYDPTLDGGTAYCEARRKPDGKRIIRHFSMANAKRARLLEKNTPWQTYPERMLMFRARSWALRDAFGDVLSGLRGAEEERDIFDEEPAEEPVSSLEQLTEKLKEPTAEALPLSKHDDPEPADEEIRQTMAGGQQRAAERRGRSASTPESEQQLQELVGVAHHTREPTEDPLADPPTPDLYQRLGDRIEDPPCDPPIGGEEEATQVAHNSGEISNAERRSEEDRHFREFTQALADAESASQIADLGKKLDEFHEAGLLAGLDYLALKKKTDAAKTRMSQ